MKRGVLQDINSSLVSNGNESTQVYVSEESYILNIKKFRNTCRTIKQKPKQYS